MVEGQGRKLDGDAGQPAPQGQRLVLVQLHLRFRSREAARRRSRQAAITAHV